MTRLDIVIVIAQPPRVKESLVGLEGIVCGQSDPYPDGHRDYGIHFNHLGELRVVPEAFLRLTGRQAKSDEVVSRGRLHSRKGLRSSSEVANTP